MVVVTVNGLIEIGALRKAFWFTHYISFCAISALYVYTIQQCLPHQTSDLGTTRDRRSPVDTHLFEAATKCQKRIEDTTTTTSPFRRYNIILDELNKEVLQRLRSEQSPPSQEVTNATNGQSHSRVMDSSGGTPLTTPINSIHPVPFNFTLEQPFPHYQNKNQLHAQTATNNATNLQSVYAPSSIIDDSMMMDLGAFGIPGELMGWSEFDSCVSNLTICKECGFVVLIGGTF